MLEVRELPWENAQSTLNEAWYGLMETGDRHLSHAPEWLEILCRAHGKLDGLRVFVVSDGDAIVGIVPYVIHRTRMLKVPLSMLQIGGNFGAYHNDLLAPGRETDVLRACLEHARGRWHVVFAHQIVADGATAEALRAGCDDLSSGVLEYAGEASPYLAVESDWATLLASKSGNFRSNLKRKEKALRKEGELEDRWYRGAEGADELLDAIFDIEAHSWKVDAQLAITQHDHEQGLYRELVPWLARAGHLYANVLWLDGVAVAYHLCTFWNGKVTNLKTSFREGINKKASPGAVVITKSLERSFADGAREFDFLGGAQHHKMLWTESVRPHANLYLFSRHVRSRGITAAKRLIHKIRGGAAEHEDTVRRREAISSP